MIDTILNEAGNTLESPTARRAGQLALGRCRDSGECPG